MTGKVCSGSRPAIPGRGMSFRRGRVQQGRDVIALERKEDMTSRGLRSRDLGDALALTFAGHVTPRNASSRPRFSMRVEYDPFAGSRTDGPGGRDLNIDPYAEGVRRDADVFAERMAMGRNGGRSVWS
jgi:hypothetical protein